MLSQWNVAPAKHKRFRRSLCQLLYYPRVTHSRALAACFRVSGRGKLAERSSTVLVGSHRSPMGSLSKLAFPPGPSQLPTFEPRTSGAHFSNCHAVMITTTATPTVELRARMTCLLGISWCRRACKSLSLSSGHSRKRSVG